MIIGSYIDYIDLLEFFFSFIFFKKNQYFQYILHKPLIVYIDNKILVPVHF